MPKTPPEFSSLLEKAIGAPANLHDLLRSVSGPLVEGRYIHWDKIVHRKPPEGLSHEMWWLGLKLNRSVLLREIPLVDPERRPFKFGLVDPIPERLHFIDKGAAGLIGMPEQITNPETRDRYYIGSLMEEAITSSQLEGATTTRQVAKDMIRSGRPPRDRSEQMIANNFLTMRRIVGLKEQSLTPDLVFEIHRLVTDKTLYNPSAAARLREADEEVVVTDQYGIPFYLPPPAEQLERRMEEMCAFANGEAGSGFVHPVLRSIILHFWLAYDHPFVDGNGRTARGLFYWSMLHHGYWLFEFISISRILLKAPSQYARAFLYTETDDNDLTYFVLYQLGVIWRSIEALHRYIERKSVELRQVERQLRGAAIFNHRQRALLSHAIRHPDHRYTIASHQTSHNIVYQTARMDLLELGRRGLLQAEKIGRTWYFTPASDLQERLAAPGERARR